MVKICIVILQPEVVFSVVIEALCKVCSDSTNKVYIFGVILSKLTLLLKSTVSENIDITNSKLVGTNDIINFDTETRFRFDT